MIAWVEDHLRREGIDLSVLYSDINPDYYARMGYALCPSWEGFRTAANETASGKLSHRLRAIDLAEYLPRIKQTYANYHGALPLSIARSDSYWSMMLEKFAAAAFYDVGGAFLDDPWPVGDGVGGGIRWISPVGMVRLDVAWAIRDAGIAGVDRPQFQISIGPDF